MAKLEFQDIKIEFEPVVKLSCLNFRCIHNLANDPRDPQAHCNLKRVNLGADGKCVSMHLKDRIEDVSAK